MPPPPVLLLLLLAAPSRRGRAAGRVAVGPGPLPPRLDVPPALAPAPRRAPFCQASPETQGELGPGREEGAQGGPGHCGGAAELLPGKERRELGERQDSEPHEQRLQVLQTGSRGSGVEGGLRAGGASLGAGSEGRGEGWGRGQASRTSKGKRGKVRGGEPRLLALRSCSCSFRCCHGAGGKEEGREGQGAGVATGIQPGNIQERRGAAAGGGKRNEEEERGRAAAAAAGGGAGGGKRRRRRGRAGESGSLCRDGHPTREHPREERSNSSSRKEEEERGKRNEEEERGRGAAAAAAGGAGGGKRRRRRGRAGESGSLCRDGHPTREHPREERSNSSSRRRKDKEKGDEEALLSPHLLAALLPFLPFPLLLRLPFWRLRGQGHGTDQGVSTGPSARVAWRRKG